MLPLLYRQIRLPLYAVLAFALVGCATGTSAQGLISTQKLSAPLANELVGETVATEKPAGTRIDQPSVWPSVAHVWRTPPESSALHGMS